MSEPAQAGKTCDLRGIREAVCVHTGKITDSCLAKDCIEDLRVYLTVDSQHTLDCAASAKARFVELLFVDVQVECVPYSSGYFTVDVTFYYRVIADATLSAGRTNTVTGLAVFSKRLVLFGSRARGDNKERSDIDLAVYGMPQQERAAFWLDAEDLPTLLKLDIVHIMPGMNPKFLENIEKDGVTLYAAES